MMSGAGVAGDDRKLYALVALALVMSIGHHVDHVIRGNNVGASGAQDGMNGRASRLNAVRARTSEGRDGLVGPG
jgi:hypothetical protein